MLYMMLTGSNISMDYAGNNMKRYTSMVKYMIYNMGRVNKVCIKNITSCICFFGLILYYKTAYSIFSSKTSSNAMLNFVLFREGKQTPVNNMIFSNKFVFKILCRSDKEIKPLAFNQKHSSLM
jgi:hypothetical protein